MVIVLISVTVLIGFIGARMMRVAGATPRQYQLGVAILLLIGALLSGAYIR